MLATVGTSATLAALSVTVAMTTATAAAFAVMVMARITLMAAGNNEGTDGHNTKH